MTTRRTLLAAGAAAGIATALGAASPVRAALKDTDPIAHLVRRATFGPTPAVLADARRLGATAWLERQLAPETIDDGDCEAVVARFPLAYAPIPTVRASLKKNSYEAYQQLGRAAVARAAWSERQLFEMTAMFWANHLHVAAPANAGWDSRPDYEARVIRAHAFGTFADMLKASARHPAMLTYLDNRSSTKALPNENYARELLELHTVGVGRYSEKDVADAARLLTGLTVDKATGQFVYDGTRHAVGPVTVGTFTHPNATADGGEAAVLALLDHLARHRDTAVRIATKLCVRFVADEAPASLVSTLAQVYLDNGTAITPVLRALFASPEFAASAGAKTRTPLEDLTATVRALGLGPDADGGTAGIAALYDDLVAAGNAPYRWSPPNGFPDVASAWASPSGFLIRCNAHLNLATGWYPSRLTRPDDLLRSLVPVLPPTYGALIDSLAVRLVGTTLPPAHTAAVLSVARKLPTSPLTGADRQLAGAAPYLIALVLDSPSFQVR